MNKISAIQVIVDPNAAVHPCVDKAATLAEKLDARVELLVCDTKAARHVRALAHLEKGRTKDLPVEPDTLIATLAKALRSKRIEVTTCIDFAEPLHEGLLKHVRNTTADLVVKDTHHHSLLRRTLITNTDWHLIRGCAAPLLLTKSIPWRKVPTIVVALDPGHVNDKPATLDRNLLAWGDFLRKQLQGTLHAAHAYIPAPILIAAGETMPSLMGVITTELLEAEKGETLTAICDLASGVQLELANLHLQLGTAGAYLPDLTSQLNADILVAGAVSRSGVARLFIGSTAEQILENATCDILVVKPLDFASDLPF